MRTGSPFVRPEVCNVRTPAYVLLVVAGSRESDNPAAGKAQASRMNEEIRANRVNRVIDICVPCLPGLEALFATVRTTAGAGGVPVACKMNPQRGYTGGKAGLVRLGFTGSSQDAT